MIFKPHVNIVKIKECIHLFLVRNDVSLVKTSLPPFVQGFKLHAELSRLVHTYPCAISPDPKCQNLTALPLPVILFPICQLNTLRCLF